MSVLVYVVVWGSLVVCVGSDCLLLCVYFCVGWLVFGFFVQMVAYLLSRLLFVLSACVFVLCRVYARLLLLFASACVYVSARSSYFTCLL